MQLAAKPCLDDSARCAWQDTIGSFAVGKQFDALLVDACDGVTFDIFDGDSIEDCFQKFINLGDDRNIRAAWIQGGLVLWK